MRTINLPVFNISLTENDGAWSITSDLHDSDPLNSDFDPVFDAAIDGIESLILAHASNGVDVTSDEYIQGIIDAVDACANNLT